MVVQRGETFSVYLPQGPEKRNEGLVKAPTGCKIRYTVLFLTSFKILIYYKAFAMAH